MFIEKNCFLNSLQPIYGRNVRSESLLWQLRLMGFGVDYTISPLRAAASAQAHPTGGHEMSNPRTFQIQEISAHPGPVPGQGTRREEEVCKYIDVTTCIGCKACEVACVEWNDHPFRETTFDDTYQTMPSTEWNYWNLIKFAEDERDGNLMWLMRKDQCMHCEDPGCLRACPADGAIIKYENGIVDFQQDNCIGCGYCISGCPFDIPKFNEKTKKVYKCTLCSDRVGQGLEPACIKACPTGCLHFGTKSDMVQIAGLRAKQLREQSGFAECRSLRSGFNQRHARHLRSA